MTRKACRVAVLALCCVLLAAAFSACGLGSGAEVENLSEQVAAGVDTGGPQRREVVFWYTAAGQAAQPYEDAIRAFNGAQQDYEVVGRSVASETALAAALTTADAPDLFEASSQLVLRLQAGGLLEGLGAYIERNEHDLTRYAAQALAANRFLDETYALPLTSSIMQMYYNVDLLEALGYSEPPTTMEELYDMAVAATRVSDTGDIEVLGYPLFPYDTARWELVYAFGGRWWEEDGLTLCQQEASLLALEQNMAYRTLYGLEEMDEFIEAANAGRYTDRDLFFTGQQLFRFDGSWLPAMMERYGSEVHWGVALIPGTLENPEATGTSRFETDSLAIPKMAANKEGAWAFAQWLAGEETAREICLAAGSLPALQSLYDDPELLARPGYAFFIEALRAEKGVQYPVVSYADTYYSHIQTALADMYCGSKTPAATLRDIQSRTDRLLGGE